MGKAFIDRTGLRYGRLTVIRYLGIPEGKTKPTWECLCTCGNIKQVTSSNLSTGHTSSCGCLLVETSMNKRKYPKENSSEYAVWRSIRQRTGEYSGKNHRWYSDVKMCSEWLNSFDVFLADMGKRPSDKHSIERLDGAKDYTAENCVWATAQEQANNRKTNVYIEHSGKRLTLAQWESVTKIKQQTIRARIFKYGWSVQDALTIPANSRR